MIILVGRVSKKRGSLNEEEIFLLDQFETNGVSKYNSKMILILSNHMVKIELLNYTGPQSIRQRLFPMVF